MTDNISHAPDGHDRRLHRILATASRLLGLLVLTAVLVQVSWNMFAPDLLGLEPIRIRQALGLVVFVGSFAFLVRFGISGRLGATSHG